MPSGEEAVGVNLVVIMSSCIIPHVKYDTCRPKNSIYDIHVHEIVYEMLHMIFNVMLHTIFMYVK